MTSIMPPQVVLRYKLIFYSPTAQVERIKRALFAVGAGTHPGSKYTRCAFQSMGTGQFLPVGERGADPHIGKVDQVELVQEARVEVLCVGQKVVKDAVEALKREHPYEEVAYEVYKMEDF